MINKQTITVAVLEALNEIDFDKALGAVISGRELTHADKIDGTVRMVIHNTDSAGVMTILTAVNAILLGFVTRQNGIEDGVLFKHLGEKIKEELDDENLMGYVDDLLYEVEVVRATHD